MEHRNILSVPVVLIVVIALSSGCSSSPPKRERKQLTSASKALAPPPGEAQRPEKKPERKIVQFGNTLIVPVEWGRAAEEAATLTPILRAKYGPQVQVVPHVETNQILIHLPEGKGE
jgi:hypothetical protein